MFCQLETLRHCLPPSVRRTLDDLPVSLDETYERVLREVKMPNRDHARRLLQCLVVAVRPLEVKELAEVLAIDFDDAERIPKLKPDWRWEDEEQALLTSCSSLINTVETRHTRIVQFSHFSVKEYLTSERLATSSGDVSRYHINLEPAHTILAQACMGILLRSDDRVEDNGVRKISPLAGYAARHWVSHVRFERVSSFVRKAMEYLFDPEKPYFAAWRQLHDMDTSQELPFHRFAVFDNSDLTPLYYAALCGFQDLVEHLVVKYPQHVNTGGGKYGTPLVAALAGRHFQTAGHLLHNGANVDVRSTNGRTPLQRAAWYGDAEAVRVLLDYKADANIRTSQNWTPIHSVPIGSQFFYIPHHGPQMSADIAESLLKHGADINARTNTGLTPLHVAAIWGRVEIVRVLLEHGADVGMQDSGGTTPLHAGCQVESDLRRFIKNHEKAEVVRVLLGCGGNVGAKDNEGRTPLHIALDCVSVDSDDESAEADEGSVEVVRVLLEHGANVGAEDNNDRTPFQIALANGYNKIMTLLSEHGARGVL